MTTSPPQYNSLQGVLARVPFEMHIITVFGSANRVIGGAKPGGRDLVWVLDRNGRVIVDSVPEVELHCGLEDDIDVPR